MGLTRWLCAAASAASLGAVVAMATACAGAPQQAPAPAGLFHDARFAPPRERVSTDDVFALDDAMRRYLAFEIAGQLRAQGLQQGLVDALYGKHQLKLEYDSARTRNAAEAFASRSGNCLSLVIMTAAFAKELKLPVHYGSAFLEATWSRSGSLLFASGHVNVTLGRRLLDAGTSRDLSPYTIDFLPAAEVRGMRRADIGEATVLAMYANNRAAEALARDDLDAAYAWSREALRRDPLFTSAWNTLGVVYLRHGDTAEAAPVFEHVVEVDPRNTRALSNLGESFARLGRSADADAVRRRLASIEPYPPFHFFNLGMAAMQRDDFTAARDLFAREVDRADYYHEFHYWLGLADWRLGDFAAARKELALARDASGTRSQQDIYAAKLAWLQAQRPQ